MIVGGNRFAPQSAVPSRALKASINAGRKERAWSTRELDDAGKRTNTRETAIDYCCKL
jgi:hypothetical protein